MSGTTVSPLPAASSVYSQDLAIERLEAAQSPYAATEPIGQKMEWITPYLNEIDPEVGDKAMRRVVTEVFRNLDGDVDGVTLIEFVFRGT